MNHPRIGEGPDVPSYDWTEDPSPDVRDPSDWKNVIFSANGEPVRIPNRSVPADAIVRRTPHMHLSRTEPLDSGQSFDVSVYADMKSARREEVSEDIIFELPNGINSLSIEVELMTSTHFVTRSDTRQAISISRDQERSIDAVFSLEVAKNPPPSPGLVLAFFTHRGRASGKVVRTIEINEQSYVGKEAQSTGQPVAKSTQVPDSNTQISELGIRTHAVEADLNVTIVAQPNTNGRVFRCKVQTRHLPSFFNGVSSDWTPSDDSGVMVRRHMSRFTAQWNDEGGKEGLLDSLRGAGKLFWQAAPDIFKKAFWELIDGGYPLRSILIVSEEPYLPWELMIPFDQSRRSRRSLGIEFLIGRWVTAGNDDPPQRIKINNSYVIAPRYKGSKALKSSDETNYLLENFSGEEISPARIKSFQEKVVAKPVSLFHFACHGSAELTGADGEAVPLQSIELDDGENFDAAQVFGMPEEVEEAFRDSKPLVFLNACKVGQQQPELVGIGGFAPSFISLGANAVIAPLWSVKDAIASKIALEFYKSIYESPSDPFSEILRRIRSKSYESSEGEDTAGEDTYAAYCFYGDPLAIREQGH
jgi:hypothetical protein